MLQPGFDCPKDSFTEVKIPKTGYTIVHEDGQKITVKSDTFSSEVVLKKNHRKFSYKAGKYKILYKDKNGYDTFDVYVVLVPEDRVRNHFQHLNNESGHIIDGQRVFTWMDRNLVKAWRKGTLRQEVAK